MRTYAQMIGAAAILMALHFTGSAAHRPLLLDGKASCDGEFGSSTQAIVIPDATISWSMKHYSDCTNRALWLSFVNPAPDFAFYVGSGIPVKVRQAPQTRTRTPSPSLFFRQLFLRPRQFQILLINTFSPMICVVWD